MIKKTAACILIVLRVTGVYSQTAFMENKAIRLNVVTGRHFASNNVASTGASLDGNVTGIDLGIMQWGLKKPGFTRVYGTPLLGLDLRVIRMNKVDTFGYCIAVLPSYELEMLHKPSWNLATKIVYGLNFNTKGFGLNTNFDNRETSTPFNFAFDLGLVMHAKLNAKMEFNLGSGLYHVSNGSMKMPNGGVNIIYLNTGISYYPDMKPEEKYVEPNYASDKTGLYYMGYVAAGHRQLRYFSDVQEFSTFSLVNQAMYRFNHLYSVGIGLDAFYDATQPLIKDTSKVLSDINASQKLFVAAGFSNRFDLGKLFIPAGIYTYLYNTSLVKESVYIRFGLGYQFTPRFFIGSFFKGTISDLKLKSDFMEWSIGWKFE